MTLRTEERHTRSDSGALTDFELVERVRGGELALYELIMRRYNQRLFRIARGILKNDGEAEDMVQEAWIRAYRHLGEFQGPQGFGSWLCRIAANLALMRARRSDWARPHLPAEVLGRPGEITPMHSHSSTSPEDAAWNSQLRGFMEDAIDSLPDLYRSCFVMREVEQMSIRETAEALGIKPAAVKSRAFRARRLLQARLNRQTGQAVSEVFGFAGERCDRIVKEVFRNIENLQQEK